ncbi:TPA: hypothetical protein DEO28_00790 [Candidatus Dependentiae bacterium]|nr:MAG: Permease [candidate division TM6 bacterium GW2011_GWE2_31_21]KKP54130.1 MAG: Permease [candidate division TM6 bacterium GW2011_GWF2_33_332]HBS47851.1 hypothetical protein [Candidatus Dependentiae bacterium]HBZ73036.1 hypothetical protein [Candidatus Dependentiae bacterium]
MELFYPVQLLANWITFNLLHLEQNSLIAEAVNFFIFDSIKILLLLTFIIFITSIVRSFFPPQKIKALLSSNKSILNFIIAGLLGIITPFCTCSAIPLFMGFIEVGIPLGVTFSFLIASPMINEVALVLLLGLFGWKTALTYALSGLTIAVGSGLIIEKLKLEHLLNFKTDSKQNFGPQNQTLSFIKRIKFAQTYTLNILKNVWGYVILGIGVGAFIHGYVPTDFLTTYADKTKWYAVPLATLIGIPLYSNAAGVIPIVSVLTQKGVSIGTTLAFMMAITGLSLPEFMILRKIMKTKLLIIFASTVGLGIMITGYFFNIFLGN